MERRKLSQIKHDIRACYSNAGIGREMKCQDIFDHFVREAKAYERELELRMTGYVLTTQ